MDLGLQIGDILQLSPVKGEGRYRVRLIGLSPRRSLLVTAPEVKRERVEVREGLEFAVRAFAQNEALAFKTRVERVCLRPYPYLHLSYPNPFELATSRSSPRARVRLTGLVKREDGRVGDSEKVSLGDLSREGAMIWCNTELGGVGDNLVLWLNIEQMGVPPIELPFEIRNVHEQPADRDARWRFGVEFTLLTDAAAAALRSYMNKKLGKSKW
ncbi:MAG: flagellar brake protein [Hydrocarboniphaga effusa]|nr:flagellar brake protein [Hydrocarboniphaga effusa]